MIRPTLDARSFLQYAADVALTVPSLQFVGPQGKEKREWNEFCYHWFRVTARPPGGPPALEGMLSHEADALEPEIRTAKRE